MLGAELADGAVVALDWDSTLYDRSALETLAGAVSVTGNFADFDSVFPKLGCFLGGANLFWHCQCLPPAPN